MVLSFGCAHTKPYDLAAEQSSWVSNFWGGPEEDAVDATITVTILDKHGQPQARLWAVINGRPVPTDSKGRLKFHLSGIDGSTLIEFGDSEWKERLKSIGKAIKGTPSSVLYRWSLEDSRTVRVRAQADNQWLRDAHQLRVTLVPLRDEKRLKELTREEARRRREEETKRKRELERLETQQSVCCPLFKTLHHAHELLTGVRSWETPLTIGAYKTWQEFDCDEWENRMAILTLWGSNPCH